MADDEVMFSITPQGEAYCEFMIAHPDAEPAEYFSGGWDARQPEIDRLKASMAGTKSALYWQAKAESAERERDQALMSLASAQYEASAFRRQRDEAQQALAQLVGQQEGAPA
jgi:hypothetical protein